MSETENKSINPVTEESVDDILAGILNPDGSFNDEFNGLLKKYVGGGVPETVIPANTDISDRRGEENAVRIEYDEPQDISFSVRKDVDERIEEKIPVSARASYYEASMGAQRPEFTSTGDVRYPVMGTGASEERVIYDADWEETARLEAQRLQRVRQDRMLRGDSAYARSFSASGNYPRNNLYVNNPEPASEYIDPLSRDSDFERASENSQYYSSSKKSFFPEGFSAKNNTASGGKTERTRSAKSAYGYAVSTDTSWLQVEEKPKKKKGFFSRKKDSAVNAGEKVSVEEAIERLEKQQQSEGEAPGNRTDNVRISPYAEDDISVVEKETEGLRSTVAEIVDKYKKRSEEDERRRLEEEARLEDLRREAELRERRRLEEIRLLKMNMSPVLLEAVESADAEDGFDEYDDFSTEPREEKKEEASQKVYGVVFDPAVFEGIETDGEEFTEKFSDGEENNE